MIGAKKHATKNNNNNFNIYIAQNNIVIDIQYDLMRFTNFQEYNKCFYTVHYNV
jgi:hypothetical protein